MSSAELFFKEVGSLGFLSFLEIIPLWYSLKDLFTFARSMTKLSLTVKTDDFTSGRTNVDLHRRSWVVRGKCINCLTPNSDQHQSSPNNNPSNVKGKDYSTKEKVL